MDPPVTCPETCNIGQDDSSPWDQIQPVFAYPDQLPIEQPLPNEPASSSACAVDEVHPEKLPIGSACAIDEVHPEKPIGGPRDVDEVYPEKLPVKKTRPVKKQSRTELVRAGAIVPVGSSRRALRPDLIPRPPIAVPTWSIVERMGILGLMVVAVASVSVLLVSYIESLHDSVLPPSPSLAWHGGPLPSVQDTGIGSVTVDDRAATAADLASVASRGEVPTESDQPHGHASIAPDEPLSKAENNLRSAAAEEPMPPIPPVGAPAPSEPAVGLANDEMSRLIERGQDFLKEGNFAAARLLFERAANAGSAEAAVALGSTYDPLVIIQLGAYSVSPDLDRALKWYQTAADRGSADAADRYSKLMRVR